MNLLVWVAIGIILDFMFKIQSYVLHQWFADIFSPDKSVFKTISAILTSTILYIILWPIFALIGLVLKLKEWDKAYEE